MDTSSLHLPTSEPSTPTPDSTSSSFRFPTPAADERVSSWVASISAAKMSARGEPHSDEGILGESAYEFIDTDGESRDDGATESVASTDFGRPDDVASLADTEGSGDESEDEGNHISSSQTRSSHEHAVEQAFNTPTIGRSAAFLLDDLEKPLTHSIEFEEPSLGAETVSVKHTVADLNEEQTADTLKGMKLQNPPSRVLVTICQTMTKQGLSTRDPLRILYVGSHSAKQDIIHKIASSVTASVENNKRAQHLRQSMSQLYNVVPVSAFGSERTPEIELMHSSGYQIKVEDCVFAQTLKYEDDPQKPDVIKLTINDNFAYHSVPEGDGFFVEPHWELPHVAIFYCSEEDDSDARRTRTIARKFMGRYNIPSIVISHKQLFDRAPCMTLNQHSIHMCLESRDSNGRGNIVHQRLPIDLASFLNIDARQMNRNLAYLTGLHEPAEIFTPTTQSKNPQPAAVSELETAKSCDRYGASLKNFCDQYGAQITRALGVLLLSVFAAIISGIPSYRFYQVNTTPAISVNSKIMSAVPISSTATTTVSSPVASITSTSAAMSVRTQTQTVTVTQSIAFASGPNSLSVPPSMDLGKLAPQVQPSAKPVNKSASICTAEVLGDREVLIRIPSATKLSWLSREAMSINITRNNVTVETERAYTSDEGIVLLLPKNEAWGLLNVSIITTKKPRVNETFQVDFGSTVSQAWQLLLKQLSTLVSEDRTLADPLNLVHLKEMAENAAEEAVHQGQSTLSQMDEFRRVAFNQAASAGASLTDLAKSVSSEAFKRSSLISKEVGDQLVEVEAKIAKQLQALQSIREPLDEGLVKAQVRSKLLWLKLQGKEEEYREYEKRATEAVRARQEQTRQSKKVAKESKQTQRAAKKAAKKEARACKKSGKKTRA